MSVSVLPVPIADITGEIGKHLSIGPNPGTALIGNVLHLDTMLSTLVIMAILIGLALVVRRGLTAETPGPVQNALEVIVEYINNTAGEQVGESRINQIAPLAFTLAMFIFLSNLVGLIPTGGLLKSPTADLNTTLALAFIAVLYVQYGAIRAKGIGGAIGRFFHPAALAPIEILIEITKPITLAFRLFGNIASGEIMLVVIGALPLVVATATIPTVLWVAFSLVVGLIQAFIFMMLTIAYYGQGVEEAH